MATQQNIWHPNLISMAWTRSPQYAAVLGCLSLLSIGSLIAEETTTQPVKLVHDSLGTIPGNNRWDWWQARTAYVPGAKPAWITTMSETGKTTSHDFHDIFQSISHDQGKTWSAPQLIPSLQRWSDEEGSKVATGDLTYRQNPALQLRLAE